MGTSRHLLVAAALLALLAALGVGQAALGRAAGAQGGAGQVPRCEVDPAWPAIPDTVNMGEVTSVAVDRQDHVWILHRPESGPAVLEFDAAGRYLMYVADFNSRVVVVERRTLAILDAFGSEGDAPGQFRGIHHVAADSSGNLYVAESNPGSRVQKFVYRGLGAASGSVAD